MALTCIIFDCDGVLLESVNAKTRAFARLAAQYGSQAEDAMVRYHTLHGGVSRYEKFIWFFKEVLGRDISKEEAADWAERFIRYSLEEVYACALVPGALDVLKEWKGKVPMYVASGAPHEELTDVLTKKKLAPYFSGIFGAPPAKAALLRNIVHEAGVKPEETMMVGDSKTDMDAAVIVGTKFYGRGEYFRTFGYPWYEDLTCLNAYLKNLS